MSQWRSHGYRQWLIFHNVVDESDTVSENAVRIDATGIDCEKLLLTLKAHYADMIQRWIVTPADEMNHKLSVFKNITNAVIAMRRAEILKVRLEIDQEKLELLQQKLGNKISVFGFHASLILRRKRRNLLPQTKRRVHKPKRRFLNGSPAIRPARQPTAAPRGRTV